MSDDNANHWYLNELDYQEMRKVRKGFYGRGEELNLELSKEYNVGLIIRKAGLELAQGLLHLGYLFPAGSDLKDAIEPEPED